MDNLPSRSVLMRREIRYFLSVDVTVFLSPRPDLFTSTVLRVPIRGVRDFDCPTKGEAKKIPK